MRENELLKKGGLLTTIDICRKCDSKNTSCCTLRSDGLGKMMIPPVSEAEIKQILDFLRLKNRDKIFEEKGNSHFYTLQMINLFPDMEESIFDAFSADKTHFELKTMDTGCVLLGTKGCVLPREIRPHFCRIYPFWFFEDEPHIFQDSDCLALQTCHTIAEVLLCLGTNPEKLKQIHSRICQDWGLCLSMSQVKINIPL